MELSSLMKSSDGNSLCNSLRRRQTVAMPDSLELTAMLEIVILILTVSFLQIHTDPLNLSAAARLIALGN